MKRGNLFATAPLHLPAVTAFEQFVRAQGIPEELWTKSRELRAWARRNYTVHYVPEVLLHRFGLNPERERRSRGEA